MGVYFNVYKRLPFFAQNWAVTFFNSYQYMIRRRGTYRYYRDYYRRARFYSSSQWLEERKMRLSQFLESSTKSSSWYSGFRGRALTEFPVLTKEDLIENLGAIATIKASQSIISVTGGTTGASMKVYYTHSNMQERFAILDDFRSQYGYELGEKVAWFSGKNIASDEQVKAGYCYRDDYINKVRFFSTFHINEVNFESYWNALEQFAPKYIVGFPSSVFDICQIAQKRGLSLSENVKVFFSTAETVLSEHRQVIGGVLGCRLIDQYASSEGAPFIVECTYGNLHIHPLTGVFEVVDENLHPAREGELLVTSFTTEGTPIIRYRIGDRVSLEDDDKVCDCGSSFPLVARIDGRSSDYVLSPENGRVNLGNISNATKDIAGIIGFQIIQNSESSINLKICASSLFTKKDEARFVAALRERLGESLLIDVDYTESLPREPSGKFRIVKNLIE